MANENKKTNEVKDTAPAVAPAPAPTAPTAPVNQPKPDEGVSESPAVAPAAPAPEADEQKPEDKSEDKSGKKHSVTYIANGLWTDATGQTWSRDAHGKSISHKVFTDAELAERKDIQYMIEYGSMKDLLV